MLLKLDVQGSPLLEIKRANENYTDFFYHWWNNGELMQHVGFREGLDISKENVIKSISSGNLFVVLLDGEPIGEVNYKVKEMYEFGIKLIPTYQGKGYGKKVLKLFFEYLHYIGAKDIVAYVMDTNRRAQRLYSSLGFDIVEVQKGSWLDPDGNKRDTITMVKKYGN